MSKGDTIFAFKKEQLVQIVIDLKGAALIKKQDSLKTEKINNLNDIISLQDSIINTLRLNSEYYEIIINNDSTIINTQADVIDNKNKEINKHVRDKKIIAGSGGIIIVVLLLLL